MTVQPWEPVRIGYFEDVQWPVLSDPKPGSFYGFYPARTVPVYVTLANGQKIIVRAKR